MLTHNYIIYISCVHKLCLNSMGMKQKTNHGFNNYNFSKSQIFNFPFKKNYEI
jgi:hypothetical protein